MIIQTTRGSTTRTAFVVGLVFALCCSLALRAETPAAAQAPDDAMLAWSGENFTGSVNGYSSLGPAEYVAGDADSGLGSIGDNNIESIEVKDGWEAVLCDYADATGTCRTYSAGVYSALADMADRVSYVCIKRARFVVADSIGSPCSIYNTSPADYALNAIVPISENECRSEFGFRFAPHEPRDSANPTTYNSKVMVLVHNPLIQRANDDSVNVKRLLDTGAWGGNTWNDTDAIAACVARFFEHTSSARMELEMVGTVDMDLWPDNDMLKGSAFAEQAQGDRSISLVEPSDMVDGQEISQMIEHKVRVGGRTVCEWIASGDVDELWFFNAGAFGYAETRLVGPDAYFYNGGSINNIDCGAKTFRIVGPSASRSAKEAIHNYMHGTDDAMKAAYGSAAGLGPSPHWTQLSDDSALRMFLRTRKEVYEEDNNNPVGGCGSAHFPPINPTKPIPGGWANENRYDGGDDLVEWSFPSVCDQMGALSERGPMTPALAQQIRDAAIEITCSKWDCSELGFYEWWFENLSDGAGCQQVEVGNPDGMAHDWWAYIDDPASALVPCDVSAEVQPPPPAAVTPVGPEVMHVVTCLGLNGRVDTNIVNVGDRDAVYRIEFDGLTARAANVAAGDWWRMPITGRSDRAHRVVVKRDSVVVSSATVTVRCDEGSQRVDEPEVQVVNACRNGFGYVLFQFANPTAAQRGWIIEFDGVPNRSTSAAGFAGSIRSVTGRPDGTYDAVIKTDGIITHEVQVDVACP